MSAPSGGLWPLLLHRNHAADGGRGQDSMGTTLEAGVWSMFGSCLVQVCPLFVFPQFLSS